MSAERKPRKLVLLAAVLCLMAVAACGGHAEANSRVPAASHLSKAADLAAGQRTSVSIYACLTAGKLTHVSMAAAPKCPAKSVLVKWPAQSGPTSSAKPLPSSAPSAGPSPASSPSQTPSAPSTPQPTGRGTACVTSSDNGSCGPYTYAGISGSGGHTHVIQDIWNPINGATQALTASSPENWSVLADMPTSNTAVVSYPDIQQIYTTTGNTPNPLSGYSSIAGSYTENGPASSGDDYEAAYDIWAGTGSHNYAQEIMIWVDNHGQTPAGSVVASATIDDVRYKIWSTGKAGTVGNTVSMVLNSNQPSGSVNILDDLKWLESNGYMPTGSGLNQVDFGWEFCSTGGVPQTFTMSQYGLKVSCTSGSSCTS